jgi:DNA-binding response OmpR family regulator
MNPILQDNQPACPRQILIVDDDVDILSLLKIQLRNNDWKIFTATDADMALELFVKQDIDLVITDAMMPGKSGYELVREIRASDSGKMIPIIMLSAVLDMEEQSSLAVNCGVDVFMTKPHERKNLQEQIKRLLDTKARDRNFKPV